MKFTKVFPPRIKPYHKGVYLVSNAFGQFKDFYSYWDGKNWHYAMNTIERAAESEGISIYQNRHWRGIVK